MGIQPIYKSPEGERAVMALYDAALAQWPVPYETQMIPTRHGDTFVVASGDPAAPPLVLLHGAGTNSAIWVGEIAAYSRTHRVYVVDLLGEAGKSAPNRPAWDGPAYAEWLEDVLGALGVARVKLAGISQGGWTALKFAVRCPERIDRLALICPGGVVPDRLSFVLRVIPLSLAGRWGMRRMVRLLYGSLPPVPGVEEVMGTVTRHFKSRLGTLPIFTDEELQRLTMPVFLLAGSQDALRDADKIAARLRQLVPDLAVTIIPGGGHALPETTRYMLPFLEA